MIEFHEVDESRWPDLVALMEARGGPAYCWCLLNREPPKARHGLSREGKRELMHGRIEAGTPVGILAYEDGEPVGWCSIAPRETFLDLGGPDLDNPEDGRAVWSLTCFFVPRARRGRGLGESLLEAAVETTRSRGAQVVEAYPGRSGLAILPAHGLPADVRARRLPRGGAGRHATPRRAPRPSVTRAPACVS